MTLLLIFLGDPAFAELNCTRLPGGDDQCEAGINSSMANISMNQSQQQSKWCWAACIAMIFSYYGHPVSQQRIVTETWGLPFVNFAASPQKIMENLKHPPWHDDNGKEFFVEGDVLSANALSAAKDLAADHPLIIGSMGHAMVLTAERYQVSTFGGAQLLSATVRDPWPGQGKRLLTAKEWDQISFRVRIRVSRD